MEEARKSPSCNNSEKDRISDLPLSLIHHILSFLDMKFCVQTSVLSKRWSHVWTSLPFLNLSCIIYKPLSRRSSDVDYSALQTQFDEFINFVDKVFVLHDNSDIKTLRLCIKKDWAACGDDDNLQAHLTRWILAAVRRNVQELDMEMDVEDYLVCKLPQELFSCTTLSKLKINMVGDRYPDVIIPRSVNLPHLNSLFISGLTIPNAEFANTLIPSFTLLELAVIDSTIQDDNNKAFTIDSRDLKSFTLDTHGSLWCPDETMASVIKLNAPGLISLVCRDFMTQDYSIENLDSLVTADITMILTEEEDDETIETYLELSAEQKLMFGKRMVKFLAALYNVKQLRLSCGFLEVLSNDASLLISQPRQYCNLQYLDLKMWFTTGCLRAIAYLLTISPNLKSLVLVSKEVSMAEVGDDWDVGLKLPSMLSHLKYVQVKELQGCDNEVKLLQLVLKKAMVLEEVTLFFRSTAGSLGRVSQVKRFRDKLRAVTRASSGTNMMFF